MIRQPIKWWGGKWYLAAKLHALAPPHTHRLHVYGGGVAELWNWPCPCCHKQLGDAHPTGCPGVSEVINDIDPELTTFWRVLQDAEMFRDFQRVIEAVPFSQVEFREACLPCKSRDPVDRALRFFIRCRQARCGRADVDAQFTPITRRRTRRGMNGEVSAWLSAIEGLPEVHQRLKRVLILCEDAPAVIKSQDDTDTLFYCDPEYLQSIVKTRGVYRYGMTEDDHRYLLETLGAISGKFMLSGYHSQMYDQYAKSFGWQCHEFPGPNHAAGGKRKRQMVECVWTNYA